MIRLKFRSQRLWPELQQRIKSFYGSRASTTGARISVPNNLRWWYWLEFGTAMRGDTSEGASGHKYPIDPVFAPYLRWPAEAWPGAPIPPNDNGWYRFTHVMHPGIRPRRMITKVLDKIGENAVEQVVESMIAHGFRQPYVQRALRTKVMPQTLDLICKSMEQQAPGRRATGKLDGQSAAEAFRAGATISESPSGGIPSGGSKSVSGDIASALLRKAQQEAENY